jgi:hypothetical protein
VADNGTTTEERRSRRTSSLAREDRGTLLVIVVASAAAFVAGWFPAPDAPRVGQASAAEVRAWVATNAGALHVTATALVIAAVSFIVVASGLSALARRHLRGSQLSELVVGSAVVVAVLLVLDTAASTMPLLLPGLVDTTLADVSDPVVVGWLAIGGFTHLLGDLQLAFVALGLASGCLIALRLGLVNAWLCYGGLVVAGCAAAGILGITLTLSALYPLWFVGTFGLYVSLLVLAVSAAIAWRRLGR